jgi:hypothetical protein
MGLLPLLTYLGQSSTCCTDGDEEVDGEEEKEKGSDHWEPEEWQINEWYTELRENDITMHEYNLERIKAKRNALEEQQAEERLQREREIKEREEELEARKRELEAKEIELEEKAALLEIAIRVNELSIETRFGGLEKRFEELEIASRRRRSSFDFELKQRTNDHMNSSGNDENSTESENSN